mgnify:CR=1 FL=1
MKQRWPLLVCCGLLLLSLGCNIWLLRENRQLLAAWQPAAEVPLQVHVSGAVAKPGVYTLEKGCRIADALQAAGGALPNAVLGGLNLAKPLFDGEQIQVAQTLQPQEGSAASTTLNFLQPAAATQLINLNTATAAELETLPGIGPVKAQAIIDYRQQNGAFSRIEDLTKVSGIGSKTFEKLKHLITI